MDKNEVVSVVTTVGEFVGKFVESNNEGIKLKDPRMIVHAQEGMGFSSGVCMSGVEGPDEVQFFSGSTVFTNKTNDSVANAYREFTGSVVLP